MNIIRGATLTTDATPRLSERSDALTSPRPVSKYLQRKHSLFTLSLRARVDLDQQITR